MIVRPQPLAFLAVLAALCGGVRPCLAQGSPAAARPVIATLHFERAFQESAEGKKEWERLNKLKEQNQARIDQMRAEITKLRDKLTTLGMSISEEERKKLIAEGQDKEMELQMFGQKAERDINTQLQDVLGNFEDKVAPVIQELVREKGILVIFPVPSQGIVWADKSLDITAEVIERYNKAAAAGAPAARPAGGAGKR